MEMSYNNGNCFNRSSLTKKILLRRFYLGIVPSYNVFKYLVKGGLYVEIDCLPSDHYLESFKPGNCRWYCGVAVRAEVSKLERILHSRLKSSVVFNLFFWTFYFFKKHLYNVLQLILYYLTMPTRIWAKKNWTLKSWLHYVSEKIPSFDKD